VRAVLRLRLCAAVAAATALLAAPASAPAAAPQVTEILRYAPASAPDSAGALADGRRLVAGLRRLGLRPRGFAVLPMVVVRGTPAQLRRARALPEVVHAQRARPLELLLDESVPLVFRGAPAPVRAGAGEGRGVRVAVVDTGIDGLHPHLGPRVVHNVELALDTEALGSPDGGPNGLGLPPVRVAQPCPAACNTDVDGHGTHVAGIVAGMGAEGGSPEGMVPGADLVGLSISETTQSREWYALAAFDYLLAHPELGVRVVNNSWKVAADRFDPGDPVNQATRMLHDAGMTVVFAAGNSGQGTPAPGQPEGSSNCIDGGLACALSFQAVAPWAIAVAAGDRVAPGSPSDQHLAPFSSRGDPRPHRVGGVDVTYAPTLTAPGTSILSTAATTVPLRCVGLCHDTQQPLYTVNQGTSMAAPHVSGAIALLQTAARSVLGRELTPDEVKRVLVRGAAPMTKPFAEQGGCDYLDGVVTGCDPGTCHAVDEALGCEWEERAARPYAEWQVGAGYLDVPGALRAAHGLRPGGSPTPPLEIDPAPRPIPVPPPPVAGQPAPAPAGKPASRTKSRKAAAKKRRAAACRKAKRRAARRKACRVAKRRAARSKRARGRRR